MEPKQFQRGKKFHKKVQEDWRGTVGGSKVLIEKATPLHPDSKSVKHVRRGRMDIFVDKIEDFVTVVEIKSTDWDKIKEKNHIKLMGSHRRQILRYVDKFLNIKKISVCAAIIYPSAPKKPGLKQKVEDYLNNYGLQVTWYSEVEN
jgi:hypothetical protein